MGIVQLLGYALSITQAHTGSSVKRALILHLTPSGVVEGWPAAGVNQKTFSGRSACFFEPMVVKLVGQ